MSLVKSGEPDPCLCPYAKEYCIAAIPVLLEFLNCTWCVVAALSKCIPVVRSPVLLNCNCPALPFKLTVLVALLRVPSFV